ncbi:MAG: cation:proton antiporter [Ilumatobacteraceae bacterium]
MHSDIIPVVAAVLGAGVLAQWLGWRLKVPAIVFLLAGGIVAGPVLHLVDPDEAFGDLLFPGVSFAVAVILFEGALGLGWRGVRTAGRSVAVLLTVGASITMVGAALAAHYVLDVDWRLSTLIASVLIVTGPTVIGPIVRSVGLHGRLASLLEAEGTLIDPIGAIATVLVFQAAYEADNTGSAIGQLAATITFGGLIGAIGALFVVVTFARHLIPDQLQNATTRGGRRGVRSCRRPPPRGRVGGGDGDGHDPGHPAAHDRASPARSSTRPCGCCSSPDSSSCWEPGSTARPCVRSNGATSCSSASSWSSCVR